MHKIVLSMHKIVRSMHKIVIFMHIILLNVERMNKKYTVKLIQDKMFV